jgi:hypothetical protein
MRAACSRAANYGAAGAADGEAFAVSSAFAFSMRA